MVYGEGGDSRIWATREAEPRLPGPTWGRPVGHTVARGSGSIAASFAAVELDMLLPPLGAQLIQSRTRLRSRHVWRARIQDHCRLLRTCGAWPKTGIVQAVYRDSYVSSPLVARLLIDTMK
jgi:DEAD/DEAH box helicase domain-containing protein